LSEKLSQIDSIYILCDSFERNAEFFEASTKLRGLYTGFSLLCDDLSQLPNIQRRRQEWPVRNDFTISLVTHPADDSTSFHDTIITDQQPLPSVTDNRKRQEAEFMYLVRI
ncbi:unnamed protein product, partial [Didymodactylos carnosus]